MTRPLSRVGLRAELASAIALVTLLGVGATFLALYSGTGARLRGQLDTQLRTQAAEWHQATARTDLSTPANVEQAARSFIAAQRYHAEALIIAVQAIGGRTVSNNAEVVAREERREQSLPEGAGGMLDAPAGLSTALAVEAGNMRVLSEPIVSRGRRVGMLRVADPLRPVEDAQSSLARTFLLVGLLALVLAVIVGVALATLIASPLRRMARVAAAAEQGDLSVRTGRVRARGEVQVLSEAFDHMLDRLERAFKRQRDFVSDASHELRTPLAVMRAQVEMLDRETDRHRQHEGTTQLLRRLDELDRLVGDMLTLASAEAGQLIEPQTIDLHDFFEDLRRDLPLFGERDWRVSTVDGTLYADADRLTQVLRNLARNAVAHTNPGDQVLITATAREGLLEVIVTDTGPGIPPEQLEQIFERFHRLDGSRSSDSGGSGLGLAIARAITEAHSGTITAESAPGGGAAFRIKLPGYRPNRAPVVTSGT